MLTTIQLLKEALLNARETFEGTVADIKQEHLHKGPGGSALPLAAAYAHLILSEDMIVQNMLQGKSPLYETTWKDKTGASAVIPAMNENWETAHATWAKSLKLDIPVFKEYSQAVYSETDKYLDILKEEDLEKEIDLGPMGKKTVVYLIYAFLIGHTNNLSGEISAIKGVHGAKGYPF